MYMATFDEMRCNYCKAAQCQISNLTIVLGLAGFHRRDTHPPFAGNNGAH